MTEQQYQELSQRVAHASGIVKLICGVANNAAWVVVLDGYDAARKCKAYKHEVKRAFHLAIDAWHEYENRLIYASENRMFYVEDLGEHVRRTFGNITNRQYYDFWASVGGPAYEKTKPLITSLWNKHRLSLKAHGVKDAEHVAWVLTAAAALELAEHLYEFAIKEVMRGYDLKERMTRAIFSQFSLKPIKEKWTRAMKMLAPDTDFELEPTERRNIEHGLTQLCDAWMDPSLLYNSTMDTVEDYDEIFRTKGYQKKAMREIADVRDATLEELRK